MKRILFAIMLVSITSTSYALDVETHKKINENIAKKNLNSFSLDAYLINNIGLASGITTSFNSLEVWKWLRDGGLYEDIPVWWLKYLRSVNHFHNPLKPLSEAGFTGIWGTGTLSGESAILWSQMPAGTQIVGGTYSWFDARNYYYNALTSSNQNIRETNFADTFRGLGQVMHLVQDMSVPEHARDDGHYIDAYEEWVRDNSIIVSDATATPVFFDMIALNQPSVFGSDAPVPIANLFDMNLYDGTNPNVTQTIYGSPQTIGLAEYTNANYLSGVSMFSSDTNTFPYPRIADMLAWVDSNKRTYLGKSGSGDAVAHLAVASRLRTFLQTYAPFAVNNAPAGLDDECYKEYAQNLIPRAVGYSAGLLNYFFRGTIEITLPTSGVYSSMTETASGFTQITLLSRNTTTSGEEMTDGSIELVVKYRLSEEDPFHSIAAETSDEFFYKVAPEASGRRTIPSTDPVELTFDLSGDNEIPLWATDVYLQVVYHGKLGNEDNAVAVGFKDISEPTPIDEFNNMDKICINGTWYDAGSAAAYNALPASAKNWDYWVHDLKDEYIKISPSSSPTDASSTAYTFYKPLIEAGTLYRSYILSDYTFAHSGHGVMESIDPVIDSNDHSAAIKSSTAQGSGVVNQEETVYDQEFCETRELTAPCTVRFTSLFYTFRGVDIWGSGGVITEGMSYPNDTDPSYIPCSWSDLNP